MVGRTAEPSDGIAASRRNVPAADASDAASVNAVAFGFAPATACSVACTGPDGPSAPFGVGAASASLADRTGTTPWRTGAMARVGTRRRRGRSEPLACACSFAPATGPGFSLPLPFLLLLVLLPPPLLPPARTVGARQRAHAVGGRTAGRARASVRERRRVRVWRRSAVRLSAPSRPPGRHHCPGDRPDTITARAPAATGDGSARWPLHERAARRHRCARRRADAAPAPAQGRGTARSDGSLVRRLCRHRAGRVSSAVAIIAAAGRRRGDGRQLLARTQRIGQHARHLACRMVCRELATQQRT